MRILGVMSGSSLDGLDLVSVIYKEGPILNWELEAYETIDVPSDICDALRKITNQVAFEIADTESRYSKYVAKVINKFVEKLPGQPDCAAVHGHTVLHLPNIQTSWQLLNGGMCAALTGMDILCDFRNADMSFGGQGTPMAVIADRDLFPGYDYYINMGGIANISLRHNNDWKAYDIAPCNQVSNHYAAKKGYSFDENGQLASLGKTNTSLLNALLNEDFIKCKPPKSIDNSWIKNYWIPLIDTFNIGIEDVLKTYNTFLIKIIKSQITENSGKFLFTGGGAKNSYFMDRFRKEMGDTFECPLFSEKIVDYKESILMSYMAYLRINNRSNFIANATGASCNVVGGAWYSAQKS